MSSPSGLFVSTSFACTESVLFKIGRVWGLFGVFSPVTSVGVPKIVTAQTLAQP